MDRTKPKTLGAILREREYPMTLALRHKLWSMRTFGGYERSAAGPAKHLLQEITMELLAPYEQEGRQFDGGELADCFLLLLDMIWRSGFDLETITALAHRKMDANEKRSWPAQPDNSAAVEHDRTQAMSFEEVTFNGLVDAANRRAWATLGNAVPASALDPETPDERRIGDIMRRPNINDCILDRNAKLPADVDDNSPITIREEPAMEGSTVNALFVNGNSAVALVEDTDENGNPRFRMAEIDNLPQVINSFPKQITLEDALRNTMRGVEITPDQLGGVHIVVEDLVDNQGNVHPTVLGE